MVARIGHHLAKPPAAPRYKPARVVYVQTAHGPFGNPAPTALSLVEVHPIVVRHAFHTWLHAKAVRELISYLRSDLTPPASVPRLLERLRHYRRLHSAAIRACRAIDCPAPIAMKEAA